MANPTSPAPPLALSAATRMACWARVRGGPAAVCKAR